MSAFSEFSDDTFKELPAMRRQRLISQGGEQAAYTATEALSPVLAKIINDAYRTGLDTMADICQPGVTNAETGHTLNPVKISDETQVLAINAVIRLLLTARTEFALQTRFDGNVVIPRAEAVAMSAVVEAALGLDTSKLLEGDLFETRF